MKKYIEKFQLDGEHTLTYSVPMKEKTIYKMREEIDKSQKSIGN